jgi:DNA-binding transcriptional MerR regulator
MARKKAQAFRTITEVSDWLDTPSHVLRFWESKFPQIKPVKRAGGRRYYRPEDLKLIGGIKHLLHDKGTTIASVKEMIKTSGEESVAAYSAEPVFPEKGRRKKRKAMQAEAQAEAVNVDPPKEILTLDTVVEPTPLSLDMPVEQAAPLQLEPTPVAPLVLEAVEDAEERETTARDVISNAISRTRDETEDETTVETPSQDTDDISFMLGQLKSRAQIANAHVLDIEDMYFQLQRIRNRMKRRLESL